MHFAPMSLVEEDPAGTFGSLESLRAALASVGVMKQDDGRESGTFTFRSNCYGQISNEPELRERAPINPTSAGYI